MAKPSRHYNSWSMRCVDLNTELLFTKTICPTYKSFRRIFWFSFKSTSNYLEYIERSGSC